MPGRRTWHQLAEAARAFGDDEFTALALNGATFLFDRLVVDGRVLRSYSGGRARTRARRLDDAMVLERG